MKVDRSRGRPVRHLEWRVRILGAGAVIALAGMYFDSSWMVNVAIVTLLIGFALRFAPGGDERAADTDTGTDGDGGPTPAS
jgi:hypothetical protein